MFVAFMPKCISVSVCKIRFQVFKKTARFRIHHNPYPQCCRPSCMPSHLFLLIHVNFETTISLGPHSPLNILDISSSHLPFYHFFPLTPFSLYVIILLFSFSRSISGPTNALFSLYPLTRENSNSG